jgi:hypothetical protein
LTSAGTVAPGELTGPSPSGFEVRSPGKDKPTTMSARTSTLPPAESRGTISPHGRPAKQGASTDPAVGTRFDTLHEQLGDKFIAVEFPGKQHSTLTEHRQQEGVDRVLAFFREQLSTTT